MPSGCNRVSRWASNCAGQVVLNWDSCRRRPWADATQRPRLAQPPDLNHHSAQRRHEATLEWAAVICPTDSARSSPPRLNRRSANRTTCRAYLASVPCQDRRDGKGPNGLPLLSRAEGVLHLGLGRDDPSRPDNGAKPMQFASHSGPAPSSRHGICASAARVEGAQVPMSRTSKRLLRPIPLIARIV